LGGGKRPGYLAVVAVAADEDAPWASQLPLPAVLYALTANASVTGSGSGGSSTGAPLGALSVPAAAFVQYVVDHYGCLPAWTLFLNANGRTSFSGSTSPGAGATHPLPPAVSSSLLDVERMDVGFVAVGHYSPEAAAAAAQEGSSARSSSGSGSGSSSSSGSSGSGSSGSRISGSHSGLHRHPAEVGFALHAPPGSHAMSFVSLEARRRGCSCSHLSLLLPGELCARPWGWPRGGEFWASAARLRLRPLGFWQAALVALVTGARPEHAGRRSGERRGDFTTAARGTGAAAGLLLLPARADDDAAAPYPALKEAAQVLRPVAGVPLAAGAAAAAAPAVVARGGVAAASPALFASPAAAAEAAKAAALAARGACFDTLWHHLLGEPLYHYQPLYTNRHLPPSSPPPLSLPLT
jgi:hypothetical protein